MPPRYATRGTEVDSQLEAKVKKVKLSLGGEFKKARETTWRIEGVFGD
jgi:hypothetical protein